MHPAYLSWVVQQAARPGGDGYIPDSLPVEQSLSGQATLHRSGVHGEGTRNVRMLPELPDVVGTALPPRRRIRAAREFQRGVRRIACEYTRPFL